MHLAIRHEETETSLDCCADTPWFHFHSPTSTSLATSSPCYRFRSDSESVANSETVTEVGTCTSSLTTNNTLDWDTIPLDLDPAAGELNVLRTTRKRDQLASLIFLIEQEIYHRAEAEPTVIDFGAGSGHLGILIAHRNPHVKVVLVERKAYSIEV